MKADRKIVTAGLLLMSAVGGYVLSHVTMSAGAQTAIVNRGDGRGWSVQAVDQDGNIPKLTSVFVGPDYLVFRGWSDGRIESLDFRPAALVDPTNPGAPLLPRRWEGWRTVE